MEKQVFGRTQQGQEVNLYRMTNENGMVVKILNYGGIIVGLEVPDVNGNMEDVVLGYDTLLEYEKNPAFFGAIIGPSANRIAKATFSIDGTAYELDANEKGNNLHSHFELGFHKRIWEVEEGHNELLLTLQCKDGELGFPGNRKITVKYTLTEDNALVITYDATSDAKTLMNLTNHTYFNLSGVGSIVDHNLCLYASYYTPVHSDCIPTGEIASVQNTPFDFRNLHKVGDEINSEHEQIQIGSGYDHNFCIDHVDGSLQEFGYVLDCSSGRVMVMETDLPGVQVYTGNFIAEEVGKSGNRYGKRMGICFETQFYPNAINEDTFPNVICGPEQPYHSVTSYRFTTQ